MDSKSSKSVLALIATAFIALTAVGCAAVPGQTFEMPIDGGTGGDGGSGDGGSGSSE